MNNEFTRMQKLAGINEIKVLKPLSRIEDFLNQHKEEVFEKMFSIYDEDDQDISIDAMTDWEDATDAQVNHYGYTCAQVDFPDAAVGAQARFEPFPPDATDDENVETNIAGRKVYYFIFNY